MERITVINNLKEKPKSLLLDENNTLAEIRMNLGGFMDEGDFFLSNGVSEVERSQEKDETLKEFLGEGKTLIIGQHHNILEEDEIHEDLENMTKPNLREYLSRKGLFRGIIITNQDVQKSKEEIGFWDATEISITPARPLTTKKNEFSFSEVSRKIKESGVISASVSLDTPYGGGEAAYKSQKENSSSSEEVRQFLISKFVVQKNIVEVDPEDFKISSEFEKEVADAMVDDEIDAYGRLISVLDKWGYYAALGAKLGGSLYATEETSISSFEEAESESEEFSAAVNVKIAGIGGGAEFSTSNEKEETEEITSKFKVDEFAQIGGTDTAVSGTQESQFDRWSDSLSEADNWDIVEYTSIVPTLGLLKDKNLARRCAQIITDNSTANAVRNMQRVIEMYNYSNSFKSKVSGGI